VRLRNLGSGSTGNATVLAAGSATVLVDCGLGIRKLEAALFQAGLAPERLSAVFITHEHADHIGCAFQFASKHALRLIMSAGTARATNAHATLAGTAARLELAADGQNIDLGDFALQPFTVPHDAQEPLQLTAKSATAKFGIATDLGHASDHVIDMLQGCDVLMLEANHDPDLLAASSYPPFLKRRVAGDWGHLSNAQAAGLLSQLANPKLRCVLAAHLSQQNNRVELARASLAAVWACDESQLIMADAQGSAAWID
jgi:phosphoribosyl 1,2-cyclic phosphodiesterase